MDERTRLLNNSSINNDLLTNKREKVTFVLPSLETEAVYKDRLFSIRLCYVCMFLSSVSFTICISSIWPFLQIIDRNVENTSFYGLIVASFSVGQLFGSPFFGYISTKMGNHKNPLIVCLILTLAANVLYAYLQNIPYSSKYYMLFSRVIMGIGASCAAVVRSYVSGATNLEQRTSILANLSACQGLGFIIGPVLQAALVPLKYPGVIETPYFHLNMYTSPAFLSVLIYIVLIVVLLFKFNEYFVLNKDTERLLKKEQSPLSINSSSYHQLLQDLPPPDYIGIASSLVLFFICCFIFSFFETLSTPLTIYMYAWTKSKATLYNGLLLGGLGFLGVFVIIFTKKMTRKFTERFLMLMGYIIMLTATVLMVTPWTSSLPSVENTTIGPGFKNTTSSFETTENPANTTEFITTSVIPRGCPLNYKWCFDTPIVTLPQLIIGFFLIVFGYTISNLMSFTIYSKMLGPWPQGTMMGILTGIGSLARALGPIIVSILYSGYGPRISLIFLISLITAALVLMTLTYKRFKEYVHDKAEDLEA